jgi:hypothetical protein
MPTITGGSPRAGPSSAPTRRQPRRRTGASRQHFFLPRRYRDPFGQDAFVDFDANDLLMVETRDALGNRVTVDANDYRVLQPRLVSDPNRNQTEVAFDTLGMVVGTAVMGKPLPAPVEGDTLAGFVADLTQAQLDAFFDAPRQTRTPARGAAATPPRASSTTSPLRRRTSAGPDRPTQWQPPAPRPRPRDPRQRPAAAAGPEDPAQLLLLRRLRPRDPEEDPGRAGTAEVNGRRRGRQPVMAKPALGRQRLDHLQQQGQAGPPVRAVLQRDAPLRVRRQVGVSPVLFYDPAERVIATLHPNHTYEKVVFDPWQQTTYDVNDTCAPRNNRPATRAPTPTSAAMSPSTSRRCSRPTWQTWHAQRIGGALGPHERNAACAPKPMPTRPPPPISMPWAAPS